MYIFEDETAFVWEWLCRLDGHADARNRPFELVFAQDRSILAVFWSACSFVLVRMIPKLWKALNGPFRWLLRTYLPRSLLKAEAAFFLWLRDFHPARLSRSCTITFLERFGTRAVERCDRQTRVTKVACVPHFLLRSILTDIGQNNENIAYRCIHVLMNTLESMIWRTAQVEN